MSDEPPAPRPRRGLVPVRGALRTRWRPCRDWRELLVGSSPDAVLDRLIEGDPLALRSLCAARIRVAAVLVDADRVHLRVLAGLVFRVTTDGAPRRRRTVVDLVDRAIEEVVGETRLAHADGVFEGTPDSVFATFAGPLELDAAALGRACDAFNARPIEERAAFFALVVERRSLEDAADAVGADGLVVARRARRALDAALGAGDGVSFDPAAASCVEEHAAESPAGAPALGDDR